MSYTEEVARTKWCPFSSVVAGREDGNKKATVTGTIAFNRVELGPHTYASPDGAACMASQCMAWRWNYIDTHGPSTEGFCGLCR